MTLATTTRPRRPWWAPPKRRNRTLQEISRFRAVAGATALIFFVVYSRCLLRFWKILSSPSARVRVLCDGPPPDARGPRGLRLFVRLFGEHFPSPATT